MSAAVEVLRCKSCNAPVPLGTGDLTTCPNCGTATEIPSEHRALREAEAHESEQREAGAELVREYGRLPLLPLRMVAATWNLAFVIFIGLPVVLISGFFVGILLLRMWGAITRQHVYDVILPSFSDPQAASIAMGYLGSTLLFALWIILARYGGRRVRGLRELQAGLAAKPPEKPGGASTCRVCGAPLEVARGELSCRCLYCHSENLVAIPASWIRKAKGRAKQIGKDIEKATQAHAAELRKLRRGAAIQLAIFVVIGGAFTALLFKAAISGQGLQPSNGYEWHTNVKSPTLRRDQRMLDGLRKQYAFDHQPQLGRGSCPAPDQQPLRFGADDCTPKGCVVHFYIALERGDRIALRGTTLPHQTLAAFYEHDRDRPFDEARWGTRVGKPAWIGSDREAIFRAPHDGWFMLWIAVLEGGAPIERYQLCAYLDR